jgi:acetyltransferase-like isoleucine patch superfamily enzyme
MNIRDAIKKNFANVILKVSPFINQIINIRWIHTVEYRANMFVLRKSDIFKWRVEYLRGLGAKIGENCRLFSIEVYSEPLLLEIGEHVVVSDAVRFITHDGGVWIFWSDNPEIDNYGKIQIGDNTFIGMNAIILPNTTIGNNCVIGAGSVVRGRIPDNSIVMGNPAQVVMKTSLYEKMILSSKKTLSTALIPLDKEGRKKRNAILSATFNIKR